MKTDNLTILKNLAPSPLQSALDAFLLDRQAMNCTCKTLEVYRYALGSFSAFAISEGVSHPDEISAGLIRAYLVGLQNRGLKDTTQHLHARCIKTWLNWLVNEGDLEVSPMRRVSMPKLEKRMPAPFTPEEVQRLLDCCERRTAIGARNYAIVLTLLDTGLRAEEFVKLQVGSIDMRSGMATVMGKGQKQRLVRVGNKARSAILRMLGYRVQPKPDDPLWISYNIQGRESGALSKHGMQTMIVRLGRKAHVQPCAPHRFRRTFALWCLRHGMDLHSLRMLMGHSTLAVLQRYLDLAGEDLERAHVAHSPVDRLLDEK